jgi:hypothetical protein
VGRKVVNANVAVTTDLEEDEEVLFASPVRKLSASPGLVHRYNGCRKLQAQVGCFLRNLQTKWFFSSDQVVFSESFKSSSCFLDFL